MNYSTTPTIVYRLEESLEELIHGTNLYKGDIISQETLNKLIADGWYEIKVTIIVVQ